MVAEKCDLHSSVVWMKGLLPVIVNISYRLSRLQELIAEQCEVAAVNQILVLDGELLEQSVDSLATVDEYPKSITQHNPIYVFLKSYPDHRYFPNCIYRK